MDSFQELWNCHAWKKEVALGFTCPATWQSFDPTDSPDVRFCQVCREKVYLCQTPQEFVERGERGQCVAIPPDMRRINLKAMQVGRPSEESVRRFQRERERVRAWWQSVQDAAPAFLESGSG
jgi:hypothetical protein